MVRRRRCTHNLRMGRMLRVVIADDDVDAVRTLEALLRDEGHAVLGVTGGKQALKAIGEFGADVVLLDIGMPDMNGYAVVEELRKAYGGARPALIAITGRADPADRLVARMVGFDHYLSKPYDPGELLRLLGPYM
jgi:DNA-binding response OmpR family regulator